MKEMKMLDVDRDRLLAHIEELAMLTNQFHAVKGIRAWAAEENQQTKRDLQVRIEQLRTYIKYA